jgi:hypothetical protein
MDTSINSTLFAIAEKAPVVADLLQAREAAVRAERDVEAAILMRAIALMRPALEALCGRVPVGSREITGGRGAELTYSPALRGLCLVDGYARDGAGSGGGQYFGERLYLLVDGTLVSLRREGRWSERAGEACAWQVVEERHLSPREAMDEYPLAECLEPMLAALHQPLSGLTEPLRRTQERTEKLRAILTLI